MTTVINDAQGKITNVVNIAGPTVQCGILFNSGFAPRNTAPAGSACDSVGPYYSNPTRLNFAPRIGFAWTRSAMERPPSVGPLAFTTCYRCRLTSSPCKTNLRPSSYLTVSINLRLARIPWQDNFIRRSDSADNPPPGARLGALATSTVEAHPHRNYVLQWNLNLQRQITRTCRFHWGYVGSHGVHMLLRGDDGNMTIPTLTSADTSFPAVPRPRLWRSLHAR